MRSSRLGTSQHLSYAEAPDDRRKMTTPTCGGGSSSRASPVPVDSKTSKVSSYHNVGARADQEPDVPVGCFASAFTRRVKDQHAVLSLTENSAPSENPNSAGEGWSTLPTGVLANVFGLLHQQCASWPASQSRFAASGTCSAWRTASREAFARLKPNLRTINHPSELFNTRPYFVPTALLHCLVVRQKQASGGTLYLMYLGEPEQEQCEKFLLSASHHSRFGNSRFVMSVSRNYNATQDNPDTVACLRTNVLGTSYELETVWDGGREELAFMAGASSPCDQPSLGHMGSMAYRRNFFGIRGPRRLHVNLPITSKTDLQNNESDASSSIATDLAQEPAPVADVVDIPDPVQPKPGSISLQNVPPHWHEVLQCWCLNFGGRVKEASVKNFQLLDVQEPGSVAMQFGKVSTDRFILDFDPKKISPVQAFGVALSSFESKLPYQ